MPVLPPGQRIARPRQPPGLPPLVRLNRPCKKNPDRDASGASQLPRLALCTRLAQRGAPTRRRNRRSTERWLSGRKHRTRNAAYGQLYRGFESHPLRQTSALPGALLTVDGRALPEISIPSHSTCASHDAAWRMASSAPPSIEPVSADHTTDSRPRGCGYARG